MTKEIKTCCKKNWVIGFGYDGGRNWTYRYCTKCHEHIRYTKEYFEPIKGI